MASTFTPEYEFFIGLLLEARKNSGFTQKELADILGKPQSFVSKYERRERRLDFVEFVYIAQVLDADAHLILEQVRNILAPKGEDI